MSSCWTLIFGYFCRKRSSEALITGCCTAPWVVSSRSVPSCVPPAAGLAAGAVVAAACGVAAAGLVASAGLVAAAAAGVLVGAAAAGLVASAGFGASVGFGASAGLGASVGLAGAAVGAAAWPQAWSRTSPPSAEASVNSRRRVVSTGILSPSSRFGLSLVGPSGGTPPSVRRRGAIVALRRPLARRPLRGRPRHGTLPGIWRLRRSAGERPVKRAGGGDRRRLVVDRHPP